MIGTREIFASKPGPLLGDFADFLATLSRRHLQTHANASNNNNNINNSKLRNSNVPTCKWLCDSINRPGDAVNRPSDLDL